MALSITTVGAKVYYAVEATAGTRPTTASAWTELVGVNEAPEITLDVESLDCSDISDLITRYADGRQDPPGDVEFTLNHRDEVVTGWNTMKSAYDALTGGKGMWVEYWYPNSANSFFWKMIPKAMGNNGISANENDTIPAPCVCAEVEGWGTAITHTSA